MMFIARMFAETMFIAMMFAENLIKIMMFVDRLYGHGPSVLAALEQDRRASLLM